MSKTLLKSVQLPLERPENGVVVYVSITSLAGLIACVGEAFCRDYAQRPYFA